MTTGNRERSGMGKIHLIQQFLPFLEGSFGIIPQITNRSILLTLICLLLILNFCVHVLRNFTYNRAASYLQ